MLLRYSEVHRHQAVINVRVCQERELLGKQERKASVFSQAHFLIVDCLKLS